MEKGKNKGQWMVEWGNLVVDPKETVWTLTKKKKSSLDDVNNTVDPVMLVQGDVRFRLI